MKKAIIFDLDDTLCDYNGAKEKALKMISEELLLKEINPIDFWNIYKKKEPLLFREFVDKKITIADYRLGRYKNILMDVGYNDIAIDEFAMKLNDMYIRITNEEVNLFPDVDEALDFLRKEKYLLAILTNGPLDGQTKKIKKFNLQNKVDRIYYSEQIGFGKPSIDAYNYVARDLKLKPEEMLMIGDSIKDDYIGAKNAGLDAILIQRVLMESEFDGIKIQSLKELIKPVEKVKIYK